MKEFEMTDIGYERLTAAIITEAIRDFRKDLKYLIKRESLGLSISIVSAYGDIIKIVKFFKSEYYTTLCKIHYSRILKELINEVEESKMKDKNKIINLIKNV